MHPVGSLVCKYDFSISMTFITVSSCKVTWSGMLLLFVKTGKIKKDSFSGAWLYWTKEVSDMKGSFTQTALYHRVCSLGNESFSFILQDFTNSNNIPIQVTLHDETVMKVIDILYHS